MNRIGQYQRMDQIDVSIMDSWNDLPIFNSADRKDYLESLERDFKFADEFENEIE